MNLSLKPYGVCVALAVLMGAAVLMLRRKRLAADTTIQDALALTGLCAFFGLVGARLLYCLFNVGYYASIGDFSGCFDIRQGGFLLFGAIAGAALGGHLYGKSAGLSTEHTLNALCVPALICLALCRFSEVLPFESVGIYIEEEGLQFFPLAVCNEWGEWYLAVFVFESLLALILAIVASHAEKRGDPRLFLHILLYFAAFQIPLESLRMDSSLKLGFVRVNQVCCALTLLLLAVLLIYRDHQKMFGALGCVVLGLGGVGTIEWALEKTEIPNVVLYILMVGLCAGMCVSTRLLEKAARVTQQETR